jgi:hypothetical protein
MKVLYDGWPLVYRPNSPAALHTLNLLARLPQEIDALLALPAPSPHPLPAQMRQCIEPTGSSSSAQLLWEQRRLPALAKGENVDLIHLTGDYPALFGPAINLTSPSGFELNRLFNLRARSPQSLVTRLRSALAHGGASRLRGVLWPNDLPAPGIQAPLLRLPALVHPAFFPNHNAASGVRTAQTGTGLKRLASQDLPETYVLYHGPGDEGDMGLLFDAWTWAAGSIGEYYPLLLLGQASAAKRIQGMVMARGLAGTVQVLPNLDMESLISLYRRCSALFHPAPVSPWGSPGRLALASHKPVVSLENRFSDALFGPAAYLVPEQNQGAPDARALGAAILTVIVEPSLTETLVQEASRRAAAWLAPDFESELYSAYQKLLAGKELK